MTESVSFLSLHSLFFTSSIVFIFICILFKVSNKPISYSEFISQIQIKEGPKGEYETSTLVWENLPLIYAFERHPNSIYGTKWII